ncbi:MAG: peptide deformylase [Candidatus Portnoybacteria bacterium]|nr:peptide deformylase [Candidatus Portnoybacteria bacterium]
MEIKKYGERILRKKTRPVAEVNDEIRQLVAFMVKEMYAHQGVGLAANQIGIDLNLAVVDVGNGVRILINPKILKAEGQTVEEEGCLSLPGKFFKIKRPQYVEVEALDRFGRLKKIKAQDYEARAFCHEIDHLNGRLIIDKAGFWQRLKYRFKL